MASPFSNLLCVFATYTQGKDVFPEFAWTLENSVIVRDRKQIIPAEDYIDSNTLDVKMFMAFFTPSTQVLQLFLLEIHSLNSEKNSLAHQVLTSTGAFWSSGCHNASSGV